LQALDTPAFVRGAPVNVESEPAWSRALAAWKQAVCTRWIKILLVVSLCTVLLSVYFSQHDMGGPVMAKLHKQCSHIITRDSNSRALMLDIVADPNLPQHTIQQSLLNTVGFDSAFSQRLGAYYKLFCYP
jgi:hypothetical protein